MPLARSRAKPRSRLHLLSGVRPVRGWPAAIASVAKQQRRRSLLVDDRASDDVAVHHRLATTTRDEPTSAAMASAARAQFGAPTRRSAIGRRPFGTARSAASRLRLGDATRRGDGCCCSRGSGRRMSSVWRRIGRPGSWRDHAQARPDVSVLRQMLGDPLCEVMHSAVLMVVERRRGSTAVWRRLGVVGSSSRLGRRCRGRAGCRTGRSRRSRTGRGRAGERRRAH